MKIYIFKTIITLLIPLIFMHSAQAGWKCDQNIINVFVNGINTSAREAQDNANYLSVKLKKYLQTTAFSVSDRARITSVFSVYNQSNGFFSDVSEAILQVNNLDEIIRRLDRTPTWWTQVQKFSPAQKDVLLKFIKLKALMNTAGDEATERFFSNALTNPMGAFYADFFSSVFILRNELRLMHPFASSLKQLVDAATWSILEISRNYQKDISKVANEINLYRNAGNKVVIVCHSQGNLYIEEYLKRYGRNGVEVVWVAPPNKEPVYNPSCVNMLQEDAMSVFFIGHRYSGTVTNYPYNLRNILPASLSTMVPVMRENKRLYGDPTGHGFSSCYLGGASSRNTIASEMFSAYLNLANCNWVVPIPCGTTIKGGSEGRGGFYAMGSRAGNVHVYFDTIRIPDRLVITQGGRQLYDTGYWSGTRSVYIGNDPAFGNEWRFDVYGNSDSGTSWELRITCPQ